MLWRKIAAFWMGGALAAGVMGGVAAAAPIIQTSLEASLTTGSLAGTNFPVAISYDAALVAPSGQSYIPLNSINFTLLGVAFDKSYIFQGGQAIFLDGALDNVTASFQVTLPPNAPVENITFGLGNPEVIGYIDLGGQFGGGSFTIASAPEPSSLWPAAACGAGLLVRPRRNKGLKGGVRPPHRRA